MDTVERHPIVLVVDDDADTRELYRVILESVGYQVADGGSVAAAAASLRHVRPDVVLTDWLLPDGDALAVCALLRSRRATRHVPLVGATGLGLDAAQSAQARECGCVAVLEKPVDPDTLLRALHGALEEEAARRVRVAVTRMTRYARRAQGAGRGTGAPDVLAALLTRAAANTDAAVVLVAADDSARYVAASDTTLDLTGYEPGELVAMTVWDLTPPKDSAQAHRLWRQFLTAGVQEGRYVVQRRDGGTVEAHYCGIANVLPGLHVGALAAAMRVPASFAV